MILALRAPRSYSTGFPADENPISEGGRWAHNGANETVVKTETIGGVHVAHGTQTGGSFDDSGAYLLGFRESHEIEGTIYKAAGISGVNHEVELLLSWRDDYAPYSSDYGTTTAKGYEINIQSEGLYLNLGRFKRLPALITIQPLGFTPADGDNFKARLRRNLDGSVDIWCWWNRVLLSGFPYHDTTPDPPGFPGMQFFIDSGGDNSKFGFRSIVARDL